MDDLISREQAIKSICEDGTWLERQGCVDITMAERKQRDVDILQALPSAEPVQKTGKWIPCSERKPKQQQPVIITDEGDVLTGYINSLNEWMDFHGNRLKGVIAWMPLPEPYKGDKS